MPNPKTISNWQSLASENLVYSKRMSLRKPTTSNGRLNPRSTQTTESETQQHLLRLFVSMSHVRALPLSLPILMFYYYFIYIFFSFYPTGSLQIYYGFHFSVWISLCMFLMLDSFLLFVLSSSLVSFIL